MGCAHCPQSNLAAAYTSPVRVMTMHTFETILNKLPADCQIHMSGFSECFLNHLCGEMIHAASDTGREVHLYSTLSGLTEQQVFQLSRSRLKYVRLHAPDKTGFKMDTGLWIKRLHLFAASGHHFTAMAMSAEVDPLIIMALDQYQVKLEHPQMLSRAGLLWKDKHLTGPIRCAADRWHNNVVLPNGDVQVCCMSYNLSMPLGNLLTQSYAEIETRANEYAANDNPPDNSICRDCDWCATK